MLRWIGIGVLGILGVYSRYSLSLAFNRIFPSSFPLGTLIINCIGAFFIGVIFVLGSERGLLNDSLRIALSVGYLGGLTTFSTFCLETIQALERGHLFQALTYVFLSNSVGLIATYAGIAFARY